MAPGRGRGRRAERERIALDFHDVVVQGLAIIAVQAAAAADAMEVRPDDVRRSLVVIRRAARQSLDEMHRLMNLLEPSGGRATRPSVVGLDQLDRLIERFVATGLHVISTQTGRPRLLDPGLSVAVYRVVEDALDEAVRRGHLDVAVLIAFERGAVLVEIEAPSRLDSDQASSGGNHRAFAKIRERVTLFKGALRIGHRPGGGFHLFARLPTGNDDFGGRDADRVDPGVPRRRRPSV